jgi:adenine-specific DNA-methyltransferase
MKGDNLDALKILKNYYAGKVKMIYIDPPYNTASDQFLYKDNFSADELNVLGLAEMDKDDIERLEFSFKTKGSHNGWLAFIYSRLKLAKNLLSDDGVIFISIDDNEYANLKLICDEIFGEGNFVGNCIRKTASNRAMAKEFSILHEYLLIYKKTDEASIYGCPKKTEHYSNPDNDPKGLWTSGNPSMSGSNNKFPIVNPYTNKVDEPPKGRGWAFTENKMAVLVKEGKLVFKKKHSPQERGFILKNYLAGKMDNELVNSLQFCTNEYLNQVATKNDFDYFDEVYFSNPKPVFFISSIIKLLKDKSALVLDFFAGSGTTGQAVMELNAADGGNRKFILCQIDEAISKEKPAYKFCKENNLDPVISSITCERLKRAGEKIKKEAGLANDDLDVGYKVFDLASSPTLEVDENNKLDLKLNGELTAIDRIYDLIFKAGVDDPSICPVEVFKDCMYVCENSGGKNYYITNSRDLDNKKFSEILHEAVENGSEIYLDGWTTTINTVLQEQRENVKILF